MGLPIFEGAKADDGIGSVILGPVSSRRRGREVAPLIRAGCYVTFAGAGLGLLGVLLPHPPAFNVTALVAVQVVMTLWAFAFLRFADRLPMWTVELAPAFGVLQTTAGVIFSGDPLGAYVDLLPLALPVRLLLPLSPRLGLHGRPRGRLHTGW